MHKSAGALWTVELPKRKSDFCLKQVRVMSALHIPFVRAKGFRRQIFDNILALPDDKKLERYRFLSLLAHDYVEFCCGIQ